MIYASKCARKIFAFEFSVNYDELFFTNEKQKIVEIEQYRYLYGGAKTRIFRTLFWSSGASQEIHEEKSAKKQCG